MRAKFGDDSSWLRTPHHCRWRSLPGPNDAARVCGKPAGANIRGSIGMAGFRLFTSGGSEQLLRFRRVLIAVATSLMFGGLLALCVQQGVLAARPFVHASAA